MTFYWLAAACVAGSFVGTSAAFIVRRMVAGRHVGQDDIGEVLYRVGLLEYQVKLIRIQRGELPTVLLPFKPKGLKLPDTEEFKL